MIKVIRQGVYYMEGKLVKEAHAFMTSEKKEKAVKGTLSYASFRKGKKDAAAPIVAVYLKGKLRRGVGPTDVALAVERAAKRGGFLKEKVLEFFGPGLAGLSMDMRNGLDAAMAGTGRAASVWETDEKTKEYFDFSGRDGFKELHPKQPTYYDGGIVIDLSRVEPMIGLPDGTIQTVEVFKAEGEPVQFGAAILKSGLYEELAEATEIVRGKSVSTALYVCPIGKEVAVNLAENGYFTAFIRAGASICMAEIAKADVPSVSTVAGEGYLMDARSVAATAAEGNLTSALGFEYSRRFKKYHFGS